MISKSRICCFQDLARHPTESCPKIHAKRDALVKLMENDVQLIDVALSKDESYIKLNTEVSRVGVNISLRDLLKSVHGHWSSGAEITRLSQSVQQILAMQFG